MDIHDCCKIGNLERLQQLIAEGVDVNEKDNFGWNLLSNAVLYNQLEIVKELIKNKADVNEQDNKGWTSLHHASYDSYLAIVKELLEYSDLSIENNDGETALDVAPQEINNFIKNYLELPEIKEPE